MTAGPPGARVALVHDWLTGMRGGEKVLEALIRLFPGAEIFTLLHVPGTVSPLIESRPIHTSFVQRLPAAARRYRYYLPFFPAAVESFDLREFDLVVSSSHCVAKGAVPRPGALHLSYVHTPMRYVWDLFDDYFGPGRTGPVTRTAISLVAARLRKWDVASASRVDAFAANSRHVADRIRRFYGRTSEVIHPPVDTGRFTVGAPGDYYLVAGAFAPYKKTELAIEACRLLGRRLVVVGDGQDAARLKRLAGKAAEFHGWLPDDELAAFYRGARALLFPGLEDFGIGPVESMASGRPVIAFGRGGVLDTVTPLDEPGGDPSAPPTGIFFHEQTAGSLARAIERFEREERRFDPLRIREHALVFSPGIFAERLTAAVDRLVRQGKWGQTQLFKNNWV